MLKGARMRTGMGHYRRVGWGWGNGLMSQGDVLMGEWSRQTCEWASPRSLAEPRDDTQKRGLGVTGGWGGAVGGSHGEMEEEY